MDVGDFSITTNSFEIETPELCLLTEVQSSVKASNIPSSNLLLRMSDLLRRLFEFAGLFNCASRRWMPKAIMVSKMRATTR